MTARAHVLSLCELLHLLLATHTVPVVQNWSEHVADPFAANAWNYATKFTPGN